MRKPTQSSMDAVGEDEGFELALTDLLGACDAPDTVEPEHAPAAAVSGAAPAGVVVGRLVALSPAPVVAFEEAPDGVAARTTVALSRNLVGCDVLLQFERGDLARPIITGVVQAPIAFDAEVDGRAMVVRGEERIVLQCGKASITLTRTGKVLVKGAYVSVQSSGMNRIKGGSVQIN
jgi:hypothetical protein